MRGSGAPSVRGPISPRSVGPRAVLFTLVAVLVLSSLATGAAVRGSAAAPRPHATAAEARSGAADRNVPAVRPDGPGAIVSTLDLTDGEVYSGTGQPAVQDLPDAVVYDPVNGQLYVRGDPGDAITALNGSTDTVQTSIPAPYAQNPYSLGPTMAVDPVSGELFATGSTSSNVTLIDPATDRPVGSVNVGGAPYALTYDPTNAEIYVADFYSANVTVISTATDRTVASVPVGTEPAALVPDASGTEVFVANFASDNVSVIDVATNHVVANLAAGTYPIALAVDPHDNTVDVANENNGGPSSVTVLDAANNSVVGTIGVGDGPEGLAYAPVEDRMYVANAASGNISVINQSRMAVVATIGIGTGTAPTSIVYDPADRLVFALAAEGYNVTAIDPANDRIVGGVGTTNGYAYGLAVDGANGNVFAVSEGSFTNSGPPPHAQANATVINGTTLRPVASIPIDVYPVGLTYDPSDGDLIVADPGGNDTYVVDPASERIVGTAPVGLLPKWSAYDTGTGDLFVVSPGSYNISVLGPTLDPVTSIPVGYSPSGIAYDPVNGELYVPDSLGGNVTVIDGRSLATNGSIVVKPYNDLDGIVYDPDSGDLFVSDLTGGNVTVIEPADGATVASVPVGSEPTDLAVDPANGTVFVADLGSGTVTVINVTTDRAVGNITLSEPGALLYDPANNLLYNALGAAPDLEAYNASTYAQVGGYIGLGDSQYATDLAYVPTTRAVVVSTEYQGILSILSGAAEYPVNFTETGLPLTSIFSVTLAGTTVPSTTGEVGFTEPNGTYAFTVAPVAGYQANMTAGSVVVDGGPRTIRILFTRTTGEPGTYNVTFAESGLPASTRWGVGLNNTVATSYSSLVTFFERNGSYSFTVGAVGAYSPTPATGAFTVDGGPVTEPITFTPPLPSFTVTLTATPGTLTLGGALNLTTSVQGGTAPYSYEYLALPTGCASENAATVPCTPTSPGTFPAEVVVNDSTGRHASATATVVVDPRVTTGPKTSSAAPVSGTEIAVILLAIVVVAVLLLVVWRQRRGPPPPPRPTVVSVSTSPPAPPGPSG